jgi:PD-(D/E)XK nuclease superfamily protein
VAIVNGPNRSVVRSPPCTDGFVGSGFSEDVYDRAMQVGLRLAKISYEGQKVVELKYKDHYVGEGYHVYPVGLLLIIWSIFAIIGGNYSELPKGCEPPPDGREPGTTDGEVASCSPRNGEANTCAVTTSFRNC